MRSPRGQSYVRAWPGRGASFEPVAASWHAQSMATAAPCPTPEPARASHGLPLSSLRAVLSASWAAIAAPSGAQTQGLSARAASAAKPAAAGASGGGPRAAPGPNIKPRPPPEGNAADGFGPTTDTGANDFQQGMPNQEDLYAIAWSGYPEQWFSAAGKRMTYMNAMKDLFGWDISTWNDASVTNPGVSAHNPTDDADGKVCIPDDGTGTLNNEGVFVRCCADYGWDCLKCPSGTSNAAGNGKTIYSCQ